MNIYPSLVYTCFLAIGMLLPCSAILITHYFMEFTINSDHENTLQVSETFGEITVDFTAA